MLLFESFNEIEAMCQKYDIENYTINSDGSIDVDGHVNFNWKGLKKIPLKFREVTGGFYCSNNKLTTLEGAPNSVGGNFYCSNNKLTTLEGMPQLLGIHFDCSDNKLTTLEGSPKSVGGNFHCYDNNLVTLKGAPQSVGGNFHCFKNELTTLEGGPHLVGGDFYCNDNELTTLAGAPQSVDGDFYCGGNLLDSVKKFFPDDKTFHKLCMEWEFFAGGNKIYKHRFLEAMLDINKELPESIFNYEYI